MNRLPIESSKLAVENKKLQKEYLRVRLELNATSSQDEFAKWAKLRRQHDKLLDQLEKKSAYQEITYVPIPHTHWAIGS